MNTGGLVCRARRLRCCVRIRQIDYLPLRRPSAHRCRSTAENLHATLAYRAEERRAGRGMAKLRHRYDFVKAVVLRAAGDASQMIGDGAALWSVAVWRTALAIGMVRVELEDMPIQIEAGRRGRALHSVGRKIADSGTGGPRAR